MKYTPNANFEYHNVADDSCKLYSVICKAPIDCRTCNKPIIHAIEGLNRRMRNEDIDREGL